MAGAATAAAVSLEAARRMWARRQALGAEREERAAEALVRAGWIHAIGGADLYVSIRARALLARRADVDRAVGTGALWIVPAARGCTMLIPRQDARAALSLGTLLWRRRAQKDLQKLKVPPGEIALVASAAEEALRNGPLGPAALRKALPDGMVRSFGEEGKKIGISSTLPVALRELEARGLVRRLPEGGRLDEERYVWQISTDDPFDRGVPERDPNALAAAVAELFFRRAAPATADELASWSGLGKTECRAAVAAAAARGDLLPVTVEGLDGDAYVPAGDLDELRQGAAGGESDRFSLLGFRDPYLEARIRLAPFVRPEDAERAIPSWGSGETTLANAAVVHLRPLVHDGVVAGFWEWDDASSRVVAGTFAPLAPSAAARLREAADALTTFLRDELGHARIYPMEPKKARPERLDRVRALHVV